MFFKGFRGQPRATPHGMPPPKIQQISRPCSIEFQPSLGHSQMLNSFGAKPAVLLADAIFGGLSKLWSLFGSPKLGPVLGPVL